MKRIVVALIGALFLLAACSSSPAITAKATPTTTGSEAQFLTLMTALSAAPGSVLIQSAHVMCGGLDRGITPATLYKDIINSGAFNAAGAVVFLRASVVTYCPTHEDVVPATS
jgi:hypothetical protein